MRRVLKVFTSRLFIIIPLVGVQLALIFALYYRVQGIPQLLPFLSFFAFCLIIFIYNRNEDPAYKMAWIILILGAPVIGIPFYLIAGGRRVPKELSNGTIRASKRMNNLLKPDESVLQDYEKLAPEMQNTFRYAYQASGFPVYENTECRYYSSGEEWFREYIQDLKKAKHFIFIEFFIIDQGSCWDEVLQILKQKVKEGVEVKIVYDDFGSITLHQHYDRQLRKYGIEAYRFNPIRPLLMIRMNNRDHRKITVIDNNTAYTGGVNLADEYVNRIKRFGYWKDTAIRIHGEAVWSFTVMFLGMYTYVSGKGEEIDYTSYKLPYDRVNDGGFYQPFSDSPTDQETIGLNMHLNMINHAKRYIYIDSAYLIPTESMLQALMRAAKSGIDVRILTPHIPDKKLIFQITRGNYERLLKAGVKIYEYTPGFVHAKNFVSDDKAAIIGSINTDYRSYFLHFENGILIHHTPEIIKIREDFENCIRESHEVTLREVQKTCILVRIFREILNLCVPLV